MRFAFQSRAIESMRFSFTSIALLGTIRGLAFLAAILDLAPSVSLAEIILDDFDEPFEITMSQFNGDPNMQTDVGPLDVQRWSEVVALAGPNPTGRADADLSVPSALTFELDRLNLNPENPPIVSLNLRYFFDEKDFTQGGTNDRVAIDFAHLRSAIPVSAIRVLIQDASQSCCLYFAAHSDLTSRDEPFTLEFPFDSFSQRGGGAGSVDFERAYHLIVNIRAAYFSNVDEIDFSAVVERIRITHAIPEPAPGVLAGFAFLAMVWLLARTKEFEPCGKSRFV